MAIALVDAATGTTSAGTTVSATLSGAPAAGQTLIIVPHGDATGQTLVSDDGLALREIDLRTGNGSSFWVYWRTCDGTEPTTLTFRRNDSASDNFSLNVTRWSGCNKANPVGDPDSIVTVTSDTANIPSFTTLIDNVVICTILGIPSNTTVATPPSGYTLASEVDGFNPGSSIYYVSQPTAGATGTITWVTAASATSLKGIAFALRPDPGYSYVSAIVGTGANTDNAGGNAWSNPTNIQTLGAGASASCTVNGTANQDFLDGTNLSFAVPTGATIKGYEVAVGPRLRTGGTAGDVRDGVVQLLDGGSAVGDNKARTTAWPSNDRKATLYGHPDDLWGTTLTVSDINDSGFGARLSIRGVAAGADRVGNCDCFIVTVHYEASVTGTLEGTVTPTGAFTGTATPPTFAGTLAGSVVGISAEFPGTRTLPADVGTGGGSGYGGATARGGHYEKEDKHRWTKVRPRKGSAVGTISITASFKGKSRKPRWMEDDEELLELLQLGVLD